MLLAGSHAPLVLSLSAHLSQDPWEPGVPFYPQSEPLWRKDLTGTFCPQLAEDGTKREGCLHLHSQPLLFSSSERYDRERLSRYWVIVLGKAWQKFNSNQIREERVGLSDRKSKVAAPGALILSRPPALLPLSFLLSIPSISRGNRGWGLQ